MDNTTADCRILLAELICKRTSIRRKLLSFGADFPSMDPIRHTTVLSSRRHAAMRNELDRVQVQITLILNYLKQDEAAAPEQATKR